MHGLWAEIAHIWQTFVNFERQQEPKSSLKVVTNCYITSNHIPKHHLWRMFFTAAFPPGHQKAFKDLIRKTLGTLGWWRSRGVFSFWKLKITFWPGMKTVRFFQKKWRLGVWDNHWNETAIGYALNPNVFGDFLFRELLRYSLKLRIWKGPACTMDRALYQGLGAKKILFDIPTDAWKNSYSIPFWERSHIPWNVNFEDVFPFPQSGIC